MTATKSFPYGCSSGSLATTHAPIGFDSLEVASDFKQGLMFSFACDSVSSQFVTHVFDATPLLRGA